MQGYWTLASDGGVFNYSSGPNAGFQSFGSTGTFTSPNRLGHLGAG
jgi:hypothetical protein